GLTTETWSGDQGEKTLRVMWPAPGDAEGLDGIVGADHELVDRGILAKLNGDGVGVLERRERPATS
ncbi:hypothetical protein, partial [Sphingomonas aerolata]|uniref:hypothetical protein n=1 Tax=Sphingomonas aerolata TaxID=185951 RepID=UPI00336528E1